MEQLKAYKFRIYPT
ncbi:helix-turn-helix domain-containing protein, partial [Enterococcus faecium]